MLQYKIDIISELAKNGINTTTAKKAGYLDKIPCASSGTAIQKYPWKY